MKKVMLFVITLIVSMFSFSSSVLALTKINFKETGNGQINMALHFEEGFVGGIDITLKIKGNVNVKNFRFADKIVSGNYDSEYKYDKEKNVLSIQVTTGGIGASHNLLNDKKELVLGTIEFTSSEKNNVNYTLEETAFKIVGNSWDSQVIDKDSIVLGEETEFVYKIEESSGEASKPENKPSEDDDKNKDNNKVDGNGDSSNNNKDKDEKDLIVDENNKDKPDSSTEKNPSEFSGVKPSESNKDKNNGSAGNKTSGANSENSNGSNEESSDGAYNDDSGDSTNQSSNENDEQDGNNLDSNQDKDKNIGNGDKNESVEESTQYNKLVWIALGATVFIAGGICLINIKKLRK